MSVIVMKKSATGQQLYSNKGVTQNGNTID